MRALRFPRRPRVLIVDREPAVCSALSLVLTQQGFESIPACSAETALARVRDERIDLLLLDLRLSDLRGDALFHYAVALQPHLAARTIFMTADESEQASSLVDACNCPLLLKPFDIADISTFLNRLVSAAGEAAS